MAGKNTDRATRMIEDIKNKLNSGERDVVQQQIKESFQALVVEPKNEIVKLPEAVFKTSFLPYFSGESKIPLSENVIANWIGIAGSPYAEVSVIDEKGDELFKTPGMMDSSNIDPTKRNPIGNMASICKEYQLRSHHLPGAASKFLTAATKAQIDTLGDAAVKETASKRWEDIVNRYKNPGQVGAKTSATPNPQDDIEDLEYD